MRLALILCAACLNAAEPTVLPLQITVGAPAGNLPFEAKPMNYEPGLTVFWLVRGEGIIGFKDDSLVITTCTGAGGKNLALKRNGSPAWKMGSFPKASEDGKFGSFSMELEAEVFGSVDQVQIEGTITMQVSDAAEPLVVPAIDPQAEGKPVTAGAFQVGVGKAGTSLLQGMFGNGDEGQLNITVQGPLEQLSAFTVTAAGAALDERGWSGSGDVRTYHFLKPAAGTAVVATLLVWKDMREITVPFRYPATR